MLGAHFDSWHAGTGATDNAAGSAVMMEAMRILKATGLRMRRTVRLALWTGEEQGLLGSRAYVKQQFGDRDTMALKPGHAQAVGLLQHGQRHAARFAASTCRATRPCGPVFAAWMEPFRSLGMTTLSIRSTGSHRSRGRSTRWGCPASSSSRTRWSTARDSHHTQHGRLRPAAGRGPDEERGDRRVVRLSRGQPRRAAAAQAAAARAAPAPRRGRPRSRHAWRWRSSLLRRRRAGGAIDLRRDAQPRRAAAGRGARARGPASWPRPARTTSGCSRRSSASARRSAPPRTLLDKAERQLREAFQSLAAEALHANRGAFLDLAKATFDGLKNETTAQMDARHKAIDTLVQPLADTLKAVEIRLGETETDAHRLLRAADRAAGRARHHHADAGARAAHAVGARPVGRDAAAARGRAGGHAAALRLRGAAGAVVRRRAGCAPISIVHLPGGKQMVVDAKVPLEAFLDAHETTDDEERTARLQAHARHVRDAHGQAGRQGATGSSSRRVARDGGDVPARRDALQRGAAARPVAHRARARAARAAGQPDHAHRAADHRGPHLAAGGAGRQLPRGGAAGPRVLRPRGASSPTTSTTCAGSSTAPCRPTTRRPGRSRAGCSSAPAGCVSWT